MAILMRGGSYVDFDPGKLRPREWAVVTGNDPGSSDGRTVYLCFGSGVVKRIATYEDAKDIILNSTEEIREEFVDMFSEILAEMERIRRETEGYKNTVVSKASEAEEAANTATQKSDAASGYSEQAEASAIKSKDYSLWSESYAIGEGGMRPDESTDSSRYYYEQVRRIAQGVSGALIPMGTVSFAKLPEQTKQPGYMYNILDPFVSDDMFKDGAGHAYPAGTNVYCTADWYWDCLAGVMVSGVKGNAESTYRDGNVNITPENIGLGYTLKFTGASTEAYDGRSEKTVNIPSYGLATTNESGLMSAGDKKKLDGIADGAGDYSLPVATSNTRGGVKIGYAQNDKNYPVKLDDEKMYVNVPWTDTVPTKSSLGLGNVDNTADANKNVLSATYVKGTYVALNGKKLSEFRSMLDSIANYSGANFSTLSSIRANAGNLITVWNNNDENTAFIAGSSHTFTLIATYTDSNYQAWLVSTYSENQNYVVIKSNGNWGQINKIGLEKNFPKVPTIPSSLKNPYSLKFTGASTVTYDGSSEQTVNIPATPTASSLGIVSTQNTATLVATSWTGSSAPFSYALSVSGVTATSIVDIDVQSSITAEQLEAYINAKIVDGGQSTNSITLKAFGDKPEVNIPIKVVVRKV